MFAYRDMAATQRMEFFHHRRVGTSSTAHTRTMARWNRAERKNAFTPG
jgi:hypothetical protein